MSVWAGPLMKIRMIILVPIMTEAAGHSQNNSGLVFWDLRTDQWAGKQVSGPKNVFRVVTDCLKTKICENSDKILISNR